MQNTLKNFLIGIGVDFDNKGTQTAVKAIDNVRSKALQAGAAVAGAFGAKALTADTANRVRQYQLLSEQLGVTTESLYALDRAYVRAGGGAGQLVGQLETLRKLSASKETGDLGWVEGAARAGLNVNSILGQDNPIEIYKSIIRQIENMSKNQQTNALAAIGLSPENINIAEDGSKKLNQQLEILSNRRPWSDQFIQDSDKFAEEWSDFWDNIGAIADRGGMKLIPAVNDILDQVNQAFDDHRDDINSSADAIFGAIADNIELVAAAGVALAASGLGASLSAMARFLPVIGNTAGKLGAVAKGLGGIGLALTASSAGASWVDGLLADNVEGYREADVKFTQWAKGLISGGSITPGDTEKLTSSPALSQRTGQTGPSKETTQAISQTGVGNQRTLQPITLNLDGTAIKTFVLEILGENEEQTIKDLRSPVNR